MVVFVWAAVVATAAWAELARLTIGVAPWKPILPLAPPICRPLAVFRIAIVF